MKNTSKWVKSMLVYLTGMLILQTGAAIFILTNIGSDPFTVFMQSIGLQLNITVGFANMFMTSIFLLVIFLIDKRRIKVGTILGMLLSGPFIDMMISVLKGIPFDSFPYGMKILSVLIACIVVAFGFSVLVSSKLGPNPNDVVPFMILDATKFQYRWIKVTLDLCYLLIGMVLGGVIGLGTVIGAFLPGPIIQFFLSKVEEPLGVFIEGVDNTLGNEKAVG